MRTLAECNLGSLSLRPAQLKILDRSWDRIRQVVWKPWESNSELASMDVYGIPRLGKRVMPFPDSDVLESLVVPIESKPQWILFWEQTLGIPVWTLEQYRDVMWAERSKQERSGTFIIRR